MSISPTTTAVTGSSTPVLPPSNFAQTGIAGVNGGYAYPPGSDMASFLDNLNNTVSAASTGPNGLSVVDWANGLAAQQQQRQAQLAQQAQQAQAQQQADASGSSSAAGSSYQILEMLLLMMASLKA